MWPTPTGADRPLAAAAAFAPPLLSSRGVRLRLASGTAPGTALRTACEDHKVPKALGTASTLAH